MGAARAERRVPPRVTVDLVRIGQAFRGQRAAQVEVVVGHLAHLLPLRDVIVLRCHPRELARRLARDPTRPRWEREQNLLAEATDLVLIEALAHRRRVWEIDTTGLPVAAVVRRVARRLARRGPPSYGSVDWLGDPWVTEHLLDWSR